MLLLIIYSLNSCAMDVKKQVVGQWCKECVLGRGGFGVVTQWRNTNSGETIALKLIRTGDRTSKRNNYREQLLREIDDIKRLSHPNIVKILELPEEMAEKLSDNIVLICMEYCTGGDLRKVLNQPENCSGLPEITIRKLLKDVNNGVEYLHKMNVIHGDIKPENIVLQNYNEVTYKLIDLGHRKDLDQNKLYSSYVGTLQYLAPEVLAQSHTFSVDYWSLGVVCHEIVTGYRPFPSDMPPLKWVSLIKSKDYEDISISKNLEGKLEFNKHLPSEHHLSQFLKDEFEFWLRLSLEWDGKIRGRNVNNEIILYSALHSILDKKIITIFTTVTLEQLSYEVDSSTAISTLKGWIERDTKHLVIDQLIVLPSGEKTTDESLACNCWDPTNEVAMAYVFSRAGLDSPNKESLIPNLVAKVLKEPKKLYDSYSIKKIWRQAIYFMQNQLYLCGTFLEAISVKLLSILKTIEELTTIDTSIASEIQQAIGMMKLCNDSITFNEENYKKYHFDKKNVISDWRKRSKLLHEHLSQMYSIAKTMSLKISDSKFNFEKVQTVHENSFEKEVQLEKILDGAYKLYKSRHSTPKELRESETNSIEMVALVQKSIEIRNEFMKNEEFINNLKSICDCENKISNLKPPLEEFHSTVKELSKEIGNFNLGMLQDVWDTSILKM